MDDLDDVFIPSFDVISPYVDSNKHSRVKQNLPASNQQHIFQDATEILTSAGILYLDESSLAFQVVNHNGYIWSSTIDYDRPSYPTTFKNRARSAIILESYNIATTNFAITEENIFQSGTMIDLDFITNGFHATIKFGRSNIQLGLMVTYDQEGIRVIIPEAEIIESENYRISSIKVYPFFGAVLEDQIPGYVFLPDGIGALVDYKQSDPLISANYQKEIYDRNPGFNTETNLTNFFTGGTRIYAPVFGFVHGINQNAVFAQIKSGAEYGIINLYYPSRNRGFTTVFPEFMYRRTYRQPIDKVGNTISLLQIEKNAMDIDIHYTLLEHQEANYVGMAKVYRNRLVDQLKEKDHQFDQIPLRLDSIGIERREGLIFPETIVMTTYQDMKEMIENLNQLDIDRIIASMHGFTRQGVTWAPPHYIRPSSRLGSKNDLRELSEQAEVFYFVTEYLMASQKSRGYNSFSDLAKKINDQTYQFRSSTDQKYLLTHSKSIELMELSMKRLSSQPIDGLAITSLGSLLYEDFSKKSSLNDMIDLYQQSLKDLDSHIALYDVNDYFWSYIDHFFDFPMFSSQLVTFDDTVPFLSIVLSGSIDLFGPYANFYPYARDELLRLIDFNIYPSFMVTKRSSKYFQKTALESIYSSRFEDLRPAINTYYHFVNDALSFVIGAKIEQRNVLYPGVVEVIYDNQISIIINYLEQAYVYGVHEIEPKNYLVIQG